MSGMACIDTDHCDLTYDDQVRMWQAEGFECVIYTTAHNTHGDRYRVIVPFSEPVDPATHDQAVRAICRTMSPKWSHDAGKSSCYSLFYFPGQNAHRQPSPDTSPVYANSASSNVSPALIATTSPALAALPSPLAAASLNTPSFLLSPDKSAHKFQTLSS
jgi:hypothetical protein